MLSVGGLFDGIGLLAYGLTLAGWQHSWLCEIDPWRRELLAHRWPGVRIYDDVRAVDARAERPVLIAGGFPCKGASTAGLRNGFEHAETVLWREMARAIRDLRPRYVLVENVANILSIHDGAVWGEVVRDLAALGFDIQWDCFPAAAFGAPHLRDRIIAIATNTACEEPWRDPGELGVQGGRQDDRGGHRTPPATTHSECDGLRQQPVPERGRGGAAFSGWAGAPAALSGEGGREGLASIDSGQPTIAVRHAERLGVQVEWGEYEPAIRRWEEVVGRAPEPLCSFRGVDARAAATVERSRLSALGDGVQVQLGRLAGDHIAALERERLRVAA